jgi:hypothetical protein
MKQRLLDRTDLSNNGHGRNLDAMIRPDPEPRFYHVQSANFGITSCGAIIRAENDRRLCGVRDEPG